MICNVRNRQPGGNYTKPRIEGSKLAQKRLQGRITHAVLLGYQADFGAAPSRPESVRFDDARSASPIFRPSPTPFRSVDPGSPNQAESSIKKFICGRSVPAGALPVKGPAKNQLRRTIMLGCHRSKPMVDQRGLSNPSPGNYRNDIDILICPRIIQESDILLSTKNIAPCNRQSALLRSSAVPVVLRSCPSGRRERQQAAVASFDTSG